MGKSFPDSLVGLISALFRRRSDNEYFFPADLGVLGTVEVTYETLPGWQSPITAITSYTALPENCKKYIMFMEEYLHVPVEWIGVGPGRESMLRKGV